ncbi:SRPBCC domain-containing protein [Tardisphaera miroshnichenkoae]
MTNMNGRIELSAPKPKVLAFVTDPDQFSTCLPNVQEFEKKSPQEFTAKFKVELPADMRKGLLANLANVGIKMNFKSEVAGDSVSIHGEGRSMGMKISIDLKMAISESAGKTGIDWNADVNAGMIMKLMGEDNFKKVADEIIGQLVSAVKAKLEVA